MLVVSARYDNPGKPYGDLEQDFSYTLEVSDAAGEADQDDDEDDGQDADGSASPWQGTRV